MFDHSVADLTRGARPCSKLSMVGPGATCKYCTSACRRPGGAPMPSKVDLNAIREILRGRPCGRRGCTRGRAASDVWTTEPQPRDGTQSGAG